MLVMAKTLSEDIAYFARLVNYKIVRTMKFGRDIAISLFVIDLCDCTLRTPLNAAVSIVMLITSKM